MTNRCQASAVSYSCRPRPRRHARLIAFAAVAACCIVGTGGCAGGDDDTAATDAASGADVDAATQTGTATPTDVSISPPVDDGTFDTCAAVPPLDEISSQLDEPVLRAESFVDAAGADVCEVSGDGVANVTYARALGITPDQSRQAHGDLGLTVVELDDPALPGAVAYGSLVAVYRGDAEYSVQVISIDTASAPDSPAAVARSAALLAAWLDRLGV